MYDDGQQRIKVPVYYYFVANTIFAKARIGDKYSKEGITVFTLFRTPPNYTLTYGVDQIAYDLFNKQMPDALKKSVAKEVEIYLQRAKLGKR